MTDYRGTGPVWNGKKTLVAGGGGPSRVFLTVPNRTGSRGNWSYRSGLVAKKPGYRSLTEPS